MKKNLQTTSLVQRFGKTFLALSLSLCVLVPTASAFADEGIEPYSWFGSTLQLGFKSKHTGETRWYDGTNVGIEMTSASSVPSSSTQTFNVELHRAHGITNDWIGTAKFKVTGFTKATWTNVGSGNYYFVFNNQSNYSVKSNDVKMYSW
ncbi:MAG: hypothetical protein HFJ72_01060 [Adlercreutzia sp.]|nr:hypothetical protein [Adlercreutzia sp.]